MHNLSELQRAGREQKTVNITYKKKQGRTAAQIVKDYHNLEVYEIRDDRLWAFDPTTAGIKQFILHTGDSDSGLLFVHVNDTKFEPKYAIKV